MSYYVVFRKDNTIHSITDDKSKTKGIYLKSISVKKLSSLEDSFKKEIYNNFDIFISRFRLVEFYGVYMNIEEREYVKVQLEQLSLSLEESITDLVYLIQPCNKNSVILSIVDINRELLKVIHSGYTKGIDHFLKHPNIIICNLLQRFEKIRQKTE